MDLLEYYFSLVACFTVFRSGGTWGPLSAHAPIGFRKVYMFLYEIHIFDNINLQNITPCAPGMLTIAPRMLKIKKCPLEHCVLPPPLTVLFP